MVTYLILNLAVLAVVATVFYKHLHKPSRAWVSMLIILLVMTAIFDSLIIMMEIVGYDTTKILGIYIGRAPIEDFFYAILAAVLVPLLWQNGKSHHAE
ncbi:hypothetical protein A2707_03725 [Candidatus Saccharibacteria bacterium RIFCSPHIGHO2_01_FULL_45_15]|nr:MAG: hypothetical protein A2707_03725 [Candidatus Saccharibacteria bacterium RIFCSPHIGHO2_01_FULL_45_15]OGL28689.1 MAG: hypothetical protein A3C39_05545 [Candidatus Saccharibacteria bacterium RIFCSPHIGHO2_02_FULL_46_12]OGL31492.1 MAG: hypothetical protein A3E76_03730 [Candidatus Saccharibacteria bacterium RIFCSPHIGHO2_12_FULL_44_22]